MNARLMRITLIGVQGLLLVLWVLNAAHYLRRSHADWVSRRSTRQGRSDLGGPKTKFIGE